MKTLKKALTAVITLSLMASIAGCSKQPLDSVSSKTFVKGLKAADSSYEDLLVEYDEDEIPSLVSTYEDDDIIYAATSHDDTVYFCYFQFDSEKAAKKYFEDYLGSWQELIEDENFDGDQKNTISDDNGYFIFDGSCDDTDFADGDVYGGVYWNGDVVIEALSTSTKGKNVDKVTAFLDEVGYPYCK